MKYTINDIKIIIQKGEGQTIEFKEEYSSSIAKDIVAFANATGGRIFIGILQKSKIYASFKFPRREPPRPIERRNDGKDSGIFQIPLCNKRKTFGRRENQVHGKNDYFRRHRFQLEGLSLQHGPVKGRDKLALLRPKGSPG